MNLFFREKKKNMSENRLECIEKIFPILKHNIYFEDSKKVDMSKIDFVFEEETKVVLLNTEIARNSYTLPKIVDQEAIEKLLTFFKNVGLKKDNDRKCIVKTSLLVNGSIFKKREELEPTTILMDLPFSKVINLDSVIYYPPLNRVFGNMLVEDYKRLSSFIIQLNQFKEDEKI